jgi:hypothetical protein
MCAVGIDIDFLGSRGTKNGRFVVLFNGITIPADAAFIA